MAKIYQLPARKAPDWHPLNSANREDPFVEWLDPRSIALVMDDRPDLYDELRAPEPRGLGWAWFVIIGHALLWTGVFYVAWRGW